MSDDPVAFAEGVEHERDRIRAAMKVRCGKTFNQGSAMYGGGGAARCGLNLGHIGTCSKIAATITITRERLEEILNG